MKKLIYMIPLLLVMISGCDDFLNEPPRSSLRADQFWKTPEDAVVGMAGMYDGLQDVLSNNYFDWGEGRSDNFTNSGTGQFQVDIAIGNLSSTIGASSWESLYRAILRANLAIKYLPGIKDLTVLQRNHYLAQAYAMRAFCYFYAVRVWGDVPVVLEPYESLSQTSKNPRTNKDEVLNNIILADLDQALTLVNRAVTGPVWEINVGGILAIKTDVHMWMKDYQKAITTSDELIALNRYKIDEVTTGTAADRRNGTIAAWKRLFTDPANTNAKEPIWSLYWNYLEDGGNGIGSRTGNGSNTSQFEVDDAILNGFEANATTKQDIRRGQTYDTLKVSTNVDKIWKYYIAIGGVIQYQSTAQCEAKLPLYRYADIILLRAEAFNQLDDPTSAVAALNSIKRRAGLPQVAVTDFPDKTSLETAILNERQLEFISEGKRWFDLVRTERYFEVMDPVYRRRQQAAGFAPTGFGNPDRVYFPIHRDILNENNLLEQNAGYN